MLPRFEVRTTLLRLCPLRGALKPACCAQDSSERCRQFAVETLLLLLGRAPGAVLSLLPYAVPVLRERLVRAERGAPPPEPSEARTLNPSRCCVAPAAAR